LQESKNLSLAEQATEIQQLVKEMRELNERLARLIECLEKVSVEEVEAAC